MIFITEKINFRLFISIIFSKKPEIIYLQDSVPCYTDNTLIKNKFENLIERLSNIKIVRMPNYKNNHNEYLSFNGLCYLANKKTLEFLESKHFEKKIQIIQKPLIEKVNNKNIIIAFKKEYLRYTFQKILFYFLITQITNSEKNTKVFFDTSDELGIGRYLKIDLSSNDFLIINNNIINKIKNVIYNFSPHLIRLTLKRSITFFKPKIKFYDVGIQLVWGLPNGNWYKEVKNFSENIRNYITDDEILQNSSLKDRRIIFLDGNKFGRKADVKKNISQKEHINQINAHIVDEKKLRIPYKIFIKDILLFGILKNFFKKNDINNISLISNKIYQKIYADYLSCIIMNQYLNIRIILSKDDYNPTHITRTIVQNKYNLLNFGVQHSSFNYPFIIPENTYTYFDNYYIVGKNFINLWKPYWTVNKHFIPVGAKRSHLFLKENICEDKRLIFTEKYKNKICILILIGSLTSAYTPSWLYKRKFENIHKLLNINENIQLILRPRTSNTIDLFLEIMPHLIEFIESGRISIEYEDYETQELTSFVNILVAEDSSELVLESTFLDNILILSYAQRYPFMNLLRGIMMKDFDELYSTIRNFVDNYKYPEFNKSNIKFIKNNYVMANKESSWYRISKDLDKNLLLLDDSNKI